MRVSEKEVSQLMEDHADVITKLGNQKIETDAHNLAAGIALQKHLISMELPTLYHFIAVLKELKYLQNSKRLSAIDWIALKK